MYADQITVGRKRSIRERLNGDVDDDLGHRRSWPEGAKRQRQHDDKWKHDLYVDDKAPQSSTKVGPGDLRFKLQKKGSQLVHQGEKVSGGRDLREKLSGIMHTQPMDADRPKAKPGPESTKLFKKSLPSSGQASLPEIKKTSTSRKKSQQRSGLSVDGLLQSLGLEKYVIMFKAEEVDMAALRHMSDEDLKALGVPMGPRKKILLALDSR